MRTALILVAVLVAAGCVVKVHTTKHGRDFSKAEIAALVAGTTEAEVEKQFGTPQMTTIAENGDELWTYTYTEAEATSSGLTVTTGPVTTKTAMLRFREGKLVKEEPEEESGEGEQDG